MAHLRLSIPGLSIEGIAETADRVLGDTLPAGVPRTLRRLDADRPSTEEPVAHWPAADGCPDDSPTDEEKVLQRVRV